LNPAATFAHNGGAQGHFQALKHTTKENTRRPDGLVRWLSWGDDPAARPRTSTYLTRRVLLGAWVIVLVVGVGTATAYWEGFVDALLRPPTPQARPTAASPLLPEPSPGERALELARLHLEQGDRAAALASLQVIAPEDPAYPFAEQLRRQVVEEAEVP
jgi:hypothetical protein